MVQLDLFHFETATPLGFVPQAVLERTLGVLLANEELYTYYTYAGGAVCPRCGST